MSLFPASENERRLSQKDIDGSDRDILLKDNVRIFQELLSMIPGWSGLHLGMLVLLCDASMDTIIDVMLRSFSHEPTIGLRLGGITED